MKNSKVFSEYLEYCRQQKIDITKWNIMSLSKKWNTGKPLTEAEQLAKLFLEEAGKYMNHSV